MELQSVYKFIFLLIVVELFLSSLTFHKVSNWGWHSFMNVALIAQPTCWGVVNLEVASEFITIGFLKTFCYENEDKKIELLLKLAVHSGVQMLKCIFKILNF